MILGTLLSRIGNAAIVLHKGDKTEVYKTIIEPLMSNGEVPSIIVISSDLGACKVKYTSEMIVLSDFTSNTLKKRIKEIKRNEKSLFKNLCLQ